MNARVAVLTFPGSNSEDETVRACRAAGLTTQLVHWSASLDDLRSYDAYVLPGGFAYEDRVRAGAIAAHDRLMEAVHEGVERGKLVLGICNGAQILLEAGLAPGIGIGARSQASFTHNEQRKFICRHVHVKLGVDPGRCAFTAALPRESVIPMWASHGEGRLAASREMLATLAHEQHIVFTYSDADGTAVDAPNGSALGAAAITNVKGNVLAIMPHAERSAWLFQQMPTPERAAARGDINRMSGSAGGSVLFTAFAQALRQG